MDQPIDKEIKQVLKNWPTLFQKYSEADSTKAIIQILNSFLPYLGIWALMYFAYDFSILLMLLLAVINAFFLVRIFIIQHDCGHRSFLKSQTWNKYIGWFCSLFTTIPFKYWARVHDFHHSHSGQLEFRDIGDIQTLTVEEYRKASKWQKIKYRIFRMPLITFVVGPIVYLFVNNRMPLISFRGWKKTHRALHLNNLLLLAVYGGLTFLLGWKFLIIQLTIVSLFGIIAVWFFFVQHQHEETYKQWKENWEYLLAAIKGSTYYKLPKMFQWLTGNIGFHHIHHLNSKIPNYHLEKCQHENPFLEKYVTKVTFWESLKCMFNKLWDEEQQKMITFSEYNRRYKTAQAA